MGLNARWLVSFALWMFPIAITLGVMFSIDAATGGKGIPKSDGGGSIVPPLNNDTQAEQQCDTFDGIQPNVLKGHQAWVLTANPWGVKGAKTGAICLTADTHNNQTYGIASDPKSKFGAPFWSTTWNYPPKADGSVWAYPNIKAITDTQQIQKFKQIDLNLGWAYNLGSENTTVVTETNEPVLTDNGPGNAHANVALDFFVDPDSGRSEQPDISKEGKFARAEVMIWFAAYGSSTFPLGKPSNPATPPVTTYTDNHGRVFNLWIGFNKDESTNKPVQVVCTWLPNTAIHTFDGDILPFLTTLTTDPKVGVAFNALQQANGYQGTLPQPTDYVGYIALGTEAYSSGGQNVTFSVPNMGLEIST